MRMFDIILKKRNGYELSKKEIDYVIDGYTKGFLPDYQISSLMMAIYFKGMSKRETLDLTKAMINSGSTMDLTDIKGIKVDKHSTGGIGDKTTLVLTPMVAACDVPVVKMSGRGLGYTGGTIDKLESFNNFSVKLTKKQFIDQVNEHNIAIAGQTENLVPADKKLYALRDVTATVDQISLIASSIMSKKIASGADAIVLDVKVGNGAFMKTEEDAEKLAKEMVEIGEGMNRKTIAIVSDMNQPLGYSVGNILEVEEAINTLKGEGPEDLLELCLTLGSHMLVLGEKATDLKEAREKLLDTIASGKALNKFKELIKIQGGNIKCIDDFDYFEQANIVENIYSIEDGYIGEINAEEIGKASLILGAGRETKETCIDLTAGVKLNKKVGDYVKKGDILAVIYANDSNKKEEASKIVNNSISITNKKIKKTELIKTVIAN